MTETPGTIPIIDCDVHNDFKWWNDRGAGALTPYLPRAYQEYVKMWGLNLPNDSGYPNAGDRGNRADSWAKTGFAERGARDHGYAGTKLELMREQLLDKYDVEYAILLGQELRPLTALPNADYAAALAHAYNDYLIERELSADRRLKGAMLIATQDVDAAVREIERVGRHPDIVQVLVSNGARLPYGNRYYHPVFEVCEAMDLPFALHTGGEGIGINGQPSLAGYGSYYVENRQVRAQGYQTHLTSMIFEGVFEKFPKLKIVFVEGGSAWLAPFLWRLDADWKALRAQTPWVKKPPSEYVWESVRFTSQPLEEPERPEQLMEILAWNRAERTLMFASDYPHWDFDSPEETFPPLPAALKRRILHDNAAELYHLTPHADPAKVAG